MVAESSERGLGELGGKACFEVKDLHSSFSYIDIINMEEWRIIDRLPLTGEVVASLYRYTGFPRSIASVY